MHKKSEIWLTEQIEKRQQEKQLDQFSKSFVHAFYQSFHSFPPIVLRDYFLQIGQCTISLLIS